jgi:hypothetical protein
MGRVTCTFLVARIYKKGTETIYMSREIGRRNLLLLEVGSAKIKPHVTSIDRAPPCLEIIGILVGIDTGLTSRAADGGTLTIACTITCRDNLDILVEERITDTARSHAIKIAQVPPRTMVRTISEDIVILELEDRGLPVALPRDLDT